MIPLSKFHMKLRKHLRCMGGIPHCESPANVKIELHCDWWRDYACML